MKTISAFMTKLHNDEDGAALVEYAVLLAAVVLIAGGVAASGLATWIGDQFTAVTDITVQ